MSNIFEGYVEYSIYENDIKDLNKPKVKVPHGTYEVKITKIVSNPSKKGTPMITVFMRILNGEFKGESLAYFQTISKTNGVPNTFQIKLITDFLNSLKTGVEIKAPKLLSDTDELLDNIFSNINSEYGVDYSEDKGFDRYKIIEVFSL
jgi:hypothetical protein